MKFTRSAGVLLHPTSLPGANGIGDLGPDAYRFVDFLANVGCTVWQLLPLGPTGYGDSPYQCFSAFAGNPLLIHIPRATSDLPQGTVDYAKVIPHKRKLLNEAFERFVPDNRYQAFVQKEQAWLDDFALFMAIKQAHDGDSWTAWAPALAQRDVNAIAEFKVNRSRAIDQVMFEQYVFHAQFHALRKLCTERGIRLMGDVPIYVAHDSAEVWANRELFQLDQSGALVVQAGVPPDYFSETGQLWGNPIYSWEAMHNDGYRWWINRMRRAFTMFDIVRLDHFRGFEAYWEVPGNAVNAIRGRWVKGPGVALFRAILDALGPVPIVAENLGLITPEVEALRTQLGFPGMSILQFAFSSDDGVRMFAPHHFVHDLVVYTGTHDNDTTVGWWNSKAGASSTRTAEDIAAEQAFVKRYFDSDGHDMHWTMIRAALGSVADMVLIPMQDILGLGSEARMNLPGRTNGNWQFRFTWDQVTPAIAARLRELVTLYDRGNQGSASQSSG